jgi:hypothetical protein
LTISRRFIEVRLAIFSFTEPIMRNIPGVLPVMLFFSLSVPITSNAAEETLQTLPKMYLTTHIEQDVPTFDGTFHPSFSIKYYFGTDKEYLDELSFFGGNLARAVKPVPSAYALMQTYLWSRIGSLAFILGGFGFTVGNFIYQANHGMKEQDATGRPGSFNPTPLYIGLGFVGAGVVLHFSRHIWVHLSVSAYNRKMSNANRF